MKQIKAEKKHFLHMLYTVVSNENLYSCTYEYISLHSFYIIDGYFPCSQIMSHGIVGYPQLFKTS